MSDEKDIEIEEKKSAVSVEKVEKKKMLPNEFANQKGISKVIVAGAFLNKVDKLIREEEFDKEIKSFLDKKANGGS